MADFIFGGCKITVNGDCSHEIKRGLLLGRKVMTNLDRCLGLVHWDDHPEGWYGEGGGRRVQDGENMTNRSQEGKVEEHEEHANSLAN